MCYFVLRDNRENGRRASYAVTNIKNIDTDATEVWDDLSLRVDIIGSQMRYRDRVGQSDSHIEAFGVVCVEHSLFYKPILSKPLCINSEGVHIDGVLATISIFPRPDNVNNSALIKASDFSGTSHDVEDFYPVGWVFVGEEPEPIFCRSSAHICIKLLLDRQNYADLLGSIFSSDPCCRSLYLDLPLTPISSIELDTENAFKIAFNIRPQIPIQSVYWNNSYNINYLCQPGLGAAPRALLPKINFEHCGWMLAQPQFRRMAAELIVSAIYVSAKTNSSVADFSTSVAKAWCIATEMYGQLLEAEKTTRDERMKANVKQKTLSQPVAIPWTKRYLDRDLKQGYDNIYAVHTHFYCEEALEEIAQKYLRSGLQSPTLEWLICDILCYRETRSFGEDIKMTFEPTIFNPLGVNVTYFEEAGNIDRMALKRLLRALPIKLTSLLIGLGIPFWIIYTIFREHGIEAAGLATIIWLGVGLSWPELKRRFGFTKGEKWGRRVENNLDVWSAMALAYRRIEPFVAPRFALDGLQSSAAKGAHWPRSVYCLLHNADRRSPVSWSTTSDDEQSLIDAVSSALEKSYRGKTSDVDLSIPINDH